MIKGFKSYQPQIGQNVFIAEDATVIGQVTLGADVSVWPQSVIRGDIHTILIGARTNVQDGAILHVTHAGPYSPEGHSLTIGQDVTIGHGAILHGCVIDDLCLIGMGAIVLDGAHLESKVFLAAGSLVPPKKILEGGFLWKGNPVQKIRPLTEQELDFLPYSALKYVELKNAYL